MRVIGIAIISAAKVSILGSTFRLLDIVAYLVVAVLLLVGAGGMIRELVRIVRSRKPEPDQDKSPSLLGALAKPAMFGAVAVLGVFGFLWTASTEVLDFDWEAEEATVVAGDQVRVRTGNICGILGPTVYRERPFGRWQRTHRFGEPNVSHWWDFAGDSYATIVPCLSIDADGFESYEVPESVEPGVVALCGTDNACARVRVVAAQASD